MKTATWFITPEIAEVKDIVSIAADHKEVNLMFPTGIATDVGRDAIHDLVVEMGWYMNAHEDGPGVVCIKRYKPNAQLSNMVFESDSTNNDSRRVHVRGFAVILLQPDGEDQWFVEEVQLLPREHRQQYDCGAWFWFEYLPRLAAFLKCETDQLKYCFVSQNTLNDLDWGMNDV